MYWNVREALDLLAAHAPTLEQVVGRAVRLIYLILDGTLIRIDRVADDRPYYSGKHKRHGVNVQVLADTRSRLLWASAAMPGSTHDLDRSAQPRRHRRADQVRRGLLRRHNTKAPRPVIAVPFRRRLRQLSTNQQAVNRSHARNRGPGERAVATLQTWKLLTKLLCCPRRATTIVAAIRVLRACS